MLPIQLLQITLIVRDLHATERAFEESLGLRVAFRDPSVATWGLENSVLPMGNTFIELLSPTSDDAPGERHLRRLGGDGGYMVILQVADLGAWRTPLAEARVRIAWEGQTEGTIHGANWAGFHLHPADTGGMMISLDQPDPPDSWAGAGPDWRDFVVQDVVDGLHGIELASDEPAELLSKWSRTLGRPSADLGIQLDRGEIRIRPSDSAGFEGLAAVELHASGRERTGESLMLGGVEFRLV